MSEPIPNRSLSPTAGVDTAGDVVDAEEAQPAEPAAAPAAAAAPTASPQAAPAPPQKSRPERKSRAKQAGAATSFVRAKIATIVWLVALLGAVILGVGALLTALDANQANAIVSFVIDRANDIDGPFADIFTFSGKNAATKQILVNWGLGAIAYLVIGRILERIIRP